MGTLFNTKERSRKVIFMLTLSFYIKFVVYIILYFLLRIFFYFKIFSHNEKQLNDSIFLANCDNKYVIKFEQYSIKDNEYIFITEDCFVSSCIFVVYVIVVLIYIDIYKRLDRDAKRSQTDNISRKSCLLKNKS